ncbi:MAG: prepilin peptidase [Actinomycetales bacterium]
MTPIVVLLSGVLGLAIGSFLNVVIWRVPRGESVVSPPSACPNCGHRIRSRDNVPVLGWLLLRGRCRDCAAPISARYPLVEAGTGVAFALVAAWVGASWLLPALLYLAAVSIALALIDIDVRRLPNAIVYPSIPVAFVLLAIPALVESDPGRLLRVLGGGLALFGFYLVARLAYPRGMGLGDVKLSGLLGMYLGWFGWPMVLVGGFLGFLLGGIFGMVFLASGRKELGSRIPFGPYMLAGAWIAIVAGQPLWAAYLGLFGLA